MTIKAQFLVTLLSVIILNLLIFPFIGKLFPAQKMTVILTTFAGKDNDGIWQGEASPFMDKLQDQKNISTELPFCDNAFTGTMYNQPVMVIISGSAKVRTAACVYNLLQKKAPSIKEIILSGIAGITPMKGGITDQYGYARNDVPVMIGDVCINSAAFDFDLQNYTADQEWSIVPNPVFWTNETISSGKVQGSLPLANELYSAASKVSFPYVKKINEDVNIKYHGESRKPKAWGPLECLEASGDLFWNDTRADMRAREIGAEWLSKIRKPSLSSRDIIVATSMEGAAAGTIIEWWNKAYKTNIAFAYVRGASNFNQPWSDFYGTPIVSGKTSIEARAQDRGASFAILTESLPVLKMLELRSKKD